MSASYHPLTLTSSVPLHIYQINLFLPKTEFTFVSDKKKIMRIDKIEIENFRGFKGKHTLSFQRDINVFVGTNGAGKSSVLDLIGMFLSNIVIQITGIEKNPFKIVGLNRLDINTDYKSTSNAINISIQKTDYLHGFPNRMLMTNSYNDDNKPGVTLVQGVFSRKSIEVMEKEQMNLPIFRDFHVKRKWKDETQIELDESTNIRQFYAYQGAFDSIDSFDKFSEWYRLQEDVENRTIIRTRNIDFKNPLLQPVRGAFDSFFMNFKSIEFKNLRVEDDTSVVTHQRNDLCVEKNGDKFYLSQLSSGEQAIFLMIADIAQRLSLANPSLENCLEGEGIILIDEIDLHLHPTWQREVLPALHKTFPNIQFFATTHSPQVISSLERRNVYLIDDFKFYNAPYTYGRDSNSILNDVFNVTERPKDAQEDFDTLYKFIDDPDTVKEAEAKLKELTAKYGANDPEIKRATLHFEFLTTNP